MLARRSAESVPGGEQHAFPLRLEIFRELADGRGLARAIDSGQHDDEGAVPFGRQRPLQRRYQERQRLPQRDLQLAALGEALLLHLLAQILQQVLRCRDPGVGTKQRGFQLLIDVGVNLAAAEQTADLRARARQTGLEPFTPGRKRCRFGRFFEEAEHGSPRGSGKNR